MELKPNCFRMKKLSGGSDRYGDCEVCGKPVDCTYLLGRMRRYQRYNGVEGLAEMGSVFGHRTCLSAQTNFIGNQE